MSDDFAAYIANTRARIAEGRRVLDGQIGALKTEIAGLDREEAAIKAYEAAKTGKALAIAGRPSRPTRARHGGRREEITNALRSTPEGMRRGELLEHFGVKGDKSAEMSISNALSALKNGGQIAHLQDGRYVAYAATDMKAAAE